MLKIFTEMQGSGIFTMSIMFNEQHCTVFEPKHVTSYNLVWVVSWPTVGSYPNHMFKQTNKFINYSIMWFNQSIWIIARHQHIFVKDEYDFRIKISIWQSDVRWKFLSNHQMEISNWNVLNSIKNAQNFGWIYPSDGRMDFSA